MDCCATTAVQRLHAQHEAASNVCHTQVQHTGLVFTCWLLTVLLLLLACASSVSSAATLSLRYASFSDAMPPAKLPARSTPAPLLRLLTLAPALPCCRPSALYLPAEGVAAAAAAAAAAAVVGCVAALQLVRLVLVVLWRLSGLSGSAAAGSAPDGTLASLSSCSAAYTSVRLWRVLPVRSHSCSRTSRWQASLGVRSTR
jgi:hypothetical protein